MKALKKIAAAVVASACAISLAACGGESASETTDLQYKDIELGTTGTDITTTIKLYSHRTDMLQDSYNGTTWEQYIAEFNEMYPNITVEVDAGTDYGNSALTRLQGGDWGDIMMIPTVDASELGNYFLSYGKVDDLKDLVHYVYAQHYKDEVYGISSTGNAVGIVYNKAVFEQAGITELPTTPEEFLDDLQAIKDNTDATPLYTNYAAGWTMGAWDAYVGGTATGDATYMNQKLLHTQDPFSDPGDGTHMYNVYKILYEAVADGLTEDDYSTTDWEGSKTQMNNGEIATMVLGSWAVSQMQAAGDNADDIGYMPFPITVDGQQYTSSTADYAYGINKDSSKENQEAAMIFVKWMTDKSGFAYNEGGLPVSMLEENDKLPELYSEFDNVTFLEDEPAVDGEEDLFNDLNSDSELAINASGDARVQAIVEHASNGDMTYDEMVEEWNGKWNQALEDEGIEPEYTTVAD
ncbi:ABC transporter substrate-binding protein [Bifidobacterium eulemuris]|uniref:Carbohydrate ABC transporter substrate-binding protein n=1 Tax=Bifidobacterium eulemuris TaxID=1765219 RepID=A0A261GBN9_9BIFI|nr:ABC transporter substrate-binding protein [Bifidobacterium eulemuris]OZG68585.1 sugar ABC transporter substrate-binding protein [Bifidobacterium eulemuris]QOL32711.1 carbohydrate ABC transporter substrate-binding protein [Bifidobacterium eulemuris]